MYTGIFFASLASLAFEVLLVRVFSILLWYHFAFMVVSIAMMGLALSGTALALFWTARRTSPLPLPFLFPLLGTAMGFAYLVAVRIPFDPVRLSWDRGQILHISLYYIVLAVPFFFNGIILASAFVSARYRPGSVYAADLAGAAAGTVLVVGLQFVLSPGQAVFACVAAASFGGVLAGGRLVRSLSLGVTAVGLALIMTAPSLIEVPVSPYKALPALLRMEGAEHLDRLDSPYGRVDLFRSPGTRHAPGLSLTFRGEIQASPGLAVDGSSVTTVSAAGRGATGDFVGALPSSLAFSLRKGGSVLLVNPRGGVQVLAAERYGAEKIVCSETNPAVLHLLHRAGINDRTICGGESFQGMARNRMEPGAAPFDLIDLPLYGTVPAAGTLGGGEDYLLTVEGIAALLRGLGPDGILNISLFLSPPYRGELRLFATVLASLERLQEEDPSSHVVAIRSLEVLSLLVKRSPFTEEEIQTVRRFIRTLWFDPIFFVGMDPGEKEVFIRTAGGDSLSTAFAALADSSRRRPFIEGYPFDISPPTDDSPFFHDSLRLTTLPEVYRLVDGKWEFFLHEGYLLPLVLVQSILLGTLLILLPAAVAGRRGGLGSGRALLYFAFLGWGYMFVEMSLMHRAILSLEHPVHAVATVLGSILVASGAGSYVSRGWRVESMWKAALAAGALVLVMWRAGPAVFATLPLLPLPMRVPAVSVMMVPPGFFMGTLFPGGIRFLTEGREKVIPWAWGINGLCSVMAPVAAILFASGTGFGAVLFTGGLCYLGASAAGAGFRARPVIGTKRTPPI